jgi:hypothetical protein
MPLEISEIGVRLSVGETHAPAETVRAAPAPSPDGGERLTAARVEEIVRACVAEVLQSLRTAEER